MYSLQRRRHEMLTAVLEFVDRYENLFPEHSVQNALAGTIRSAFEDLRSRSVDQFSGLTDARAGTIEKSKARKAVQEDLLRIARTARLISRTLPQFDEFFKLPRTKDHETLVEVARQFAGHASVHYDVFIRYSMNADFIAQLNTNIAALQDGEEKRTNAKAGHRNASERMAASFKKAMSALRDLDIVMFNILQNDSPMWNTWKSVRHVKRARRKAATGTASSDAPSEGEDAIGETA